MKTIEIKDRRDFIKWMGRSGLALTALPLLGCQTSPCLNIKPLGNIRTDDVELISGLSYSILMKEGDKVNTKGDIFGSSNDYIAFTLFPGKKDEAMLWVNHETVTPLYIHGAGKNETRKRKNIEKEKAWVGGTLLHVKLISGEWKVVEDSSYNRRLDGRTRIPFSAGTKVKGRSWAEGTLANCAGGKTPWNTILSCEENWYSYYGFGEKDKYRIKEKKKDKWKWNRYSKNPAEHYGWVVEVNPFTGEAKKLVSLGRFAHETATVQPLKDGRVAVYSSDDHADECLYKFIASKKDSLDEGTLYVADTEKGRWIPLVWEEHEVLQKHFSNQLEVLMYTRKAAELVGGTPLDRPEDIEIDPKTGAVIVALTKNKKTRPYGSLLRLVEAGGDAASLNFKAETLISGGPEAGFACPDNLAFDRNGNLWMATDIGEKDFLSDTYKEFGSNGLFFIPMFGDKAGRVIRVASAPIDSEMTGITFSPDEKSIFVSVQHPGKRSKSLDQLTSNWPSQKKGAKPQSSVIAIKGPTLDSLLS